MDKIYCGLGVYRDIETGETFEKSAAGAVKVATEKNGAEERFIKRHMALDDLDLGMEVDK